MDPTVYAEFLEHQKKFFNAYKGIYMTSTIFCAMIYPILKIGNMNGYLSAKMIIKNSLISFVKRMAILAVVGMVVLIGASAILKVKDNLLITTLLLISNTYGIMCLVVLLGMGLFNLPISFITSY